MTVLSHFLFAVSILSAAAAVALFFVLDIAKCWRMVLGRRAFYQKKRRTNGITDRQQGTAAETEAYPKTEALGQGKDKTFPLYRAESGQAVFPDGKELELIQDIVYAQDTGGESCF